jgi:uncharacterized protein (TIGR02266 family)
MNEGSARRAPAPIPPAVPSAKRHYSGVETRAQPRAPFEVEVSLESDSNFFVGLTRDISTGGVFVATYRPMAVGARLMLELSLPDGPLRVTGTVLWVREHGEHAVRGFGIGFDALGDAERARIEIFSATREPYFYEVTTD